MGGVFIGAGVASLQRQPRSLAGNMLAIERDDKRKRRRFIDYLNRLADLLDLKFLEL